MSPAWSGLGEVLGRWEVRRTKILEVFNDHFGDIEWEDADRVRRMVTEEIPARIAADPAYVSPRGTPTARTPGSSTTARSAR